MTTDAETAAAPPPDPVAKLFTDRFPSSVLESGRNAGGETQIRIPPGQVAFILRHAKEDPELGFTYLRCLTGVDQMAEGIELIYSLFSYTNRRAVHVKTTLPPDDASVESITPFWL